MSEDEEGVRSEEESGTEDMRDDLMQFQFDV
jgi:hypothetical protein